MKECCNFISFLIRTFTKFTSAFESYHFLLPFSVFNVCSLCCETVRSRLIQRKGGEKPRERDSLPKSWMWTFWCTATSGNIHLLVSSPTPAFFWDPRSLNIKEAFDWQNYLQRAFYPMPTDCLALSTHPLLPRFYRGFIIATANYKWKFPEGRGSLYFNMKIIAFCNLCRDRRKQKKLK